jgi:uncharacterized phage protein (TIGR01671 family)
MNRKISFRGYNLKNKKWLYGYYLVNRGKHFIAEEGLQPPGMTWEDFEVDPESVGQYVAKVGGKEIYEGDIVHIDSWSPYAMQICFIEGAFCMTNEKGEYLGDIHFIQHAGINQCTILGNIYDNPELLKGGNQ